MRVYEQTIRYELYSIDELESKARQAAIDNVREMIMDMREPWDFNMLLDDYFDYSLGLDNVEYEYQLNYAEGDHFNIAVKLTIDDIFELIDKLNITIGGFTRKELRTLKFYENECDGIKIRVTDNNKMLPWMHFDDMNIYYDMVYWLEWFCIRDINYDLLKRFNNIVVGLVEDIERYCMRLGYDYFYEIDDDEVLDYIMGNDVEFLEDGTIF